METEGRPTGRSDFGALLRRYRLTAGLSQEALAERARLSTEGVSALERGFRRTPQRGTLALLASALALDGERRREFEEAAARRVLLGRNEDAQVVAGPWGNHDPAALPLSLTAFVGRDTELGEISTLLREERLITLTGAGGIGKTRTALQVARSMIGSAGEACFVALAAVTDVSLVATTIASVLRVQPLMDRPAFESLLAHLKNKRVLLILDNCEHVITEAARIVEALLAGCPRLQILVTSREPLRVAGECRYRLPSLDAEDAITLFYDRARAVDQRFALGDVNMPIVAELCRRLDAVPLAIELAAGRVDMLSVRAIARMLDDRFRLLAAGQRTALSRQQTMRAAIDWSYELLAPKEQLFFARLGILAGGFTSDTAAAVCGGDDVNETDIFDLIASLTDKSLIVADTSGDEERYRLLESTAVYALEKLNEWGERERLARRHAEYFRDQARAADERYSTGSMIAWRANVEAELDNDRAALEWSLTRGNDAVLGGAIAGALKRVWATTGLFVEGRYWIGLALERVNEAEHPHVAARLWHALCSVVSGQRLHDAAERAMRLYASAGDARGTADAQRHLGFALFWMGRLEEARETTLQTLAASRASGEPRGVATILEILALIEWHQGDLRAGRELYAQALAAMKAGGNEVGIVQMLVNMAECEFSAGNPERALRLAKEALEVLSLFKNPYHAAVSYVNMAAYCIALGDLSGARESARGGLRLARQVQDEWLLVGALQHLALVASLRGATRRGAQLRGYADVRLEQLQTKRQYTEQWGYDKLVSTLHETLSHEETANVAAEGALWTEDHAVEEALKV
jgi:predicted ATPase/DNA-binding XRE family transcriptional regulator